MKLLFRVDWVDPGGKISLTVRYRDLVLSMLAPGMDLEKEFFAQLVAADQMRLYRHTSFWRSMDTFKEAQELNELWESGQAPWKTW